jgi:phosphoesterase RecJ-like protein
LGVDVSAAEIESYEVFIVLDTTAWAQLGAMGDVIRATKLRKVVLDHHVSADDLGAEVFKDTEAEATGRLVIEAADQLGVPLSPEIAVPAFVALATDTGWFRFSSTRSETLRLAARLVDAGAVPDRIYRDLYENDSLARLRLLGLAMARVQSESDGRLIYTWIERRDFDAAGALPSDSEDLINLMLAVGKSEAALILVEQTTGGFKVSFRSRCGLDCAQVAQQFGGGGHKKAAGAFLAESLESARSRTLDAMRAALT